METKHCFRRFSLLLCYVMIDGEMDEKRGMRENETLGFAAHGN